jgi:hypothetical protein
MIYKAADGKSKNLNKMNEFAILKRTVDTEALRIKKDLSEKNSKGELDILSFLELVSQRPLLKDIQLKISDSQNPDDPSIKALQKYISKAKNFQSEVINYMKNENLKEC